MLSQIVTYSVVTDSDICSEIRHNEVAHIGTSEQFETLGQGRNGLIVYAAQLSGPELPQDINVTTRTSYSVLKSMKCIRYNHAALSIKCYTALGEVWTGFS